MAGPALAARSIIAWALRGTKQLSPVKAVKISGVTSKYYPKKKGIAFGMTKIKGKPGKITTAAEYRPWAKWTFGGEKTGLGWLGIGQEGRKKALYGYTGTYKHVKKHKKLYAAGGAGAAIWDFLPGKDNPKA